MIEHTDFAIIGNAAPKNKLGIIDSPQLAVAEADLTAVRLAELQAAPIRGGFDSVHLQNIHQHIYQDLYDWAGEFRSAEVQTKLNFTFDRLARENHLKGRSTDYWTQSVSAYLYDLGIIRPFLAGNNLALREFANELALKNNLSLRWEMSSEIASSAAVTRLHQTEQSASLRRMVMLAMDTDSAAAKPARGTAVDRSIDILLGRL
jgi:cell filamentation protein